MNTPLRATSAKSKFLEISQLLLSYETVRACRSVLVVLAILAATPQADALEEIVFEDIFGRRLNEGGMTLVDWEGQIANPAIQIFVRPPSDAAFPATATLSAAEPRLYFNLPSAATVAGPSKSLSFPNASPVPVFISIFPDRDISDESHELSITFTASGGARRTQRLAVAVIDQDKIRSNAFAVQLDFSKDKTGFFDAADKRAIVRQAAEDWAYFFSGMNLGSVAANTEQTFIWNSDGFTGGGYVRNTSAYTGYLLYAYGIDQPAPPYRSGGESSLAGGFQRAGGKQLPLRRSGGTEIEVKGNYNTLGWHLATSDDDWWKASNLVNVQNDLYSIAHHEIGHALIFHPGHTTFGKFKTAGKIDDPRVVAYHGSSLPVDSTDHLDGIVDRLSKKGAFGYEYYGSVPPRRWTITKLDLLVAQAVGYELRETSAFAPLMIAQAAAGRGALGVRYSQQLHASGGIPFYRWSLATGSLPDGLVFDSFTGRIEGVPTSLGTFAFAIELRDYDAVTPPVVQNLSIRIEENPFLIIGVEKVEGAAVVKFTTVSGRSYRVECSDELGSGAWRVLADGIAGMGGIVSVSDEDAVNVPERFYRAIEF